MAGNKRGRGRGTSQYVSAPKLSITRSGKRIIKHGGKIKK